MINIEEENLTVEECTDLGIEPDMMTLFIKSYKESLLHRQGIRFVYQGVECWLSPHEIKRRVISWTRKNLPEKEMTEVNEVYFNNVSINPFAAKKVFEDFKQSRIAKEGIKFKVYNIYVMMRMFKDSKTVV